MKKMSFKSIFNWLYGATLDRAMSVKRGLLALMFLLFLGGWNSVVLGNEAPSNSVKSSRTWNGKHATFTLSGDNGNGTADCVGVKANQDIYVNWDVEDGYTITVTAIRMKVGHFSQIA